MKFRGPKGWKWNSRQLHVEKGEKLKYIASMHEIKNKNIL